MTQISNPLADMARIKESLMSMFLEDEDTVKLVMPVPDDPDFTREQNWENAHYRNRTAKRGNAHRPLF